MSDAQSSVEAVARRLCLSAGQDPDVLVYREEPFVFDTISGRVRAMYGTPIPLWHCYARMARVVLDDIAVGRIA